MGTWGLDIGGVHTKMSYGEFTGSALELTRAETVAQLFEVWRQPADLVARLAALLQSLAGRLPPAGALGVTVTAELADVFPDKAAGVRGVLDAVAAAFPALPTGVVTVEGELIDPALALKDPLRVAAANWAAAAAFASRRYPAALVVDMGSTTTDILPLCSGRPAMEGRDDTGRLRAGELLYTGALRTPVAAVVRELPWQGAWLPTATETFAVMGDVYLLLGDLDEPDYTVPTPDGGPKTVQGAARRLARQVCADYLPSLEYDVRLMALWVAAEQERGLRRALVQVLSRHPASARQVLATGAGGFVALRAARSLGLAAQEWEETRNHAGAATTLGAAYLAARDLIGQ